MPLATPLTGRIAGSAIAATTTLFVLTTFPFYPTQWSLPLAALWELAWFRPLTALTAGAVLCIPAFWNLAEAAGLLWIGMAAVWIRMARDWGRDRPFAPLLAWPLALIGLGPAFVLVAATAPTQRRRIAEATLGAVIVLVSGGLVPAAATQNVAGADDPLIYLGVRRERPRGDRGRHRHDRVRNDPAACLAPACGPAGTGGGIVGPGIWAFDDRRPAAVGIRGSALAASGIGRMRRGYNPGRLGARAPAGQLRSVNPVRSCRRNPTPHPV